MHGRFGNKFPRPEHSLTAAIAARCAAKTGYNEHSPRQAGGIANAGVYKERKTYSRNREGSDCPRQAGITMTIWARRQPCRHKKPWTDRQHPPSPGRHDPGKTRRKKQHSAQEKREGCAERNLSGQTYPGREEPRMLLCKGTGKRLWKRK